MSCEKLGGGLGPLGSLAPSLGSYSPGAVRSINRVVLQRRKQANKTKLALIGHSSSLLPI